MKCIYQISCVDPEVEEIYIGSTEDFKNRVKSHKGLYNLGKKFKVYEFIRNTGGLSNWDISPIEIIDFPISTEELRQYEQAYLDKYKPQLNSHRAYTTEEQRKELHKEYNKQYKLDNKEKIYKNQKQYYENNKEKQKEYYQKNKGKILKRVKQYKEDNKEKLNARTNCPHCNMEMSKKSIRRHIKRKHSIHPTI